MVRSKCSWWAYALLVIMLLVGATSVITAEKVKITYMNWYKTPAMVAAEEEVIRMFNQRHPDIEVERLFHDGSDAVWQKAVVMAAGDVAPDIVAVAVKSGSAARRSGLLEDLRPYMQRDNFNLSNFRPGYQMSIGPDWAWDGKIYGIPWGLGLRNPFYNRELFRQTGLAFPYKGWTTTDYMVAAQRITKDTDGDGAPNIWGSEPPSINFTYWPFVFGGDFADPNTGEISIDDPRFIRNMEWLRDIQTTCQTNWNSEFVKGNLGIGSFFDASVADFILQGQNLDWAVTWAPKAPEMDQPITYAQGHVISIMKGSKHKDAAWEFIKFYYSNEVQELFAKGFLYPMTQYGMQMVVKHLPVPSHLNKTEILAPYSNVGTIKGVPWWVPGMAKAITSGAGIGKLLSGQMAFYEWSEFFKSEVSRFAAE